MWVLNSQDSLGIHCLYRTRACYLTDRENVYDFILTVFVFIIYSPLTNMSVSLCFFLAFSFLFFFFSFQRARNYSLFYFFHPLKNILTYKRKKNLEKFFHIENGNSLHHFLWIFLFKFDSKGNKRTWKII